MSLPLEHFKDVCKDPKRQLSNFLSSERKVIGVLPYFCPEELIYASGMLPFGLWGAEIQVSESKRYFPAFICSLLHTTLELGIRGSLNGLSAIMVPISCDSLKGMGANWQYSVPDIPLINVAYAQNRKIKAGSEFNYSQLVKIKTQLEEIAGRRISANDIAEAVRVYNENRQAILAFTEEAAHHPELIQASDRNMVIKAGYFMDRAVHSQWLSELTEALKQVKNSPAPKLRVVTTGIIADSKEILKLLDICGYCIVADQVAQESVSCRTLTPQTDDPLRGLAERYAHIEGCSVLFDPVKNRGRQLVELAKANNADAVLWFMSRFCDPEEYDYVPVKKMLAENGIPLLAIDIDHQMTSFEKAHSALEAFSELL